MKKTAILLLVLIFACKVYAQLDTIYSNEGVLAVNIKEVLPDAVKFSYPTEDLLITVYKNTVQKIKYKSGRIETFAEASSFKQVKGAQDWENVSIAKVESEVKGLYKIDDVSSKAKGATTLSNMDKVKDRSYKKLKIEAAMLGANIIYLTNERVQGNQFGTQYQAGNSTETNLSGIAYSNVRPKYSEFNEIYSKINRFKLVKKLYLGRNSLDLELSNEGLPPTVVITGITENEGFIYVNSIIKTEGTNNFRVVYFDEKNIILMYKDKRKIYNLMLERF
jgi:hypothetical protein